jgi:hypothetical protein
MLFGALVCLFVLSTAANEDLERIIDQRINVAIRSIQAQNDAQASQSESSIPAKQRSRRSLKG